MGRGSVVSGKGILVLITMEIQIFTRGYGFVVVTTQEYLEDIGIIFQLSIHGAYVLITTNM